MKSRSIPDVFKLLISLTACICAGLIGSIYTREAVSGWYLSLQKPVFSPPNWVYPPVWFVLYILMGVSAFLVWRKGIANPQVRESLIVFLIQLVLNAIWSSAFFGLRSPLSGLIVIIPLWTAILLTIINFFRVSRVAAILLIPYILWVSYATVLNLSIYILNP